MKILFLNKLSKDWEVQYNKLKEEFPEVEFTELTDQNERNNALGKADAVIAGRLTAQEIESSSKLKAVIVPFTGLNNFPIEIISRKKIKLYNTHANAPYVAEHAVALALALLGKVVPFHSDLKKGIWNRTKEVDDMWMTIRNKKIGILGYGHIGIYIAKYLRVYDTHIIGFKRNIPVNKDEYADEISNDISEVLGKSDIIFNVLPLNPETRGIINAENLAQMQGKYIISVGRGETIQEEPLYNALKDNILAGVALDVWYNYPGKKEEPVLPANFPFWELPNVLLSPHKSSHTTGAVNAMIEDTCQNIRIFISSNK
ncbi:MAG: 2-hydroxyacid dehydrogenase [Ignavibacteria bacterium]